MFVEPNFENISYTNSARRGWVEVICGSMFSGKTEELIRRINRAKIAGQKFQIFKPEMDTRYHDENVVSHNSNFLPGIPVASASQILSLSENFDVIAIDEIQFFDGGIVNVINELANNGKRVIVAGLDMDFLGNPFGCMPQIMAIAEFVTKVHAICVVCGNPASYSFRLNPNNSKILIGETENYQARCRKCFLDGMKNNVD